MLCRKEVAALKDNQDPDRLLDDPPEIVRFLVGMIRYLLPGYRESRSEVPKVR